MGGDTTIGSLHWADILVIVAYFIVVLVVGILSSCRNRGSVKGYFLAGGNMHWIPVGASLFASNIGSGHFIGLAGSGAATGVGIVVFELSAIFILMVLGWVFVPVYTSAKVFTLPEYLFKRFGGSRIRVYLSVLSLLLYIFTKISADLYSGAIFINLALPINLYVAVIILLVVAAIFTISGGLTAVIWTDFIQTIIMIVGAMSLAVISFNEVGGYEKLVTKFFQAVPETVIHSNTTCGFPPRYSMNTIRGLDTALPWPGVFFGLTIASVWYWCSDQVIVQRALAAKNANHVKAGAILAGYLKFLPLWIMVFPGMIARVLYPDTVACSDPDQCLATCGSPNGCTNIAYPTLVLNMMPVAARGFMLAVMMAALISSLTSIFNSSSTIFTIDIWKRVRTNASDVELMIVGRACVLVVVGFSIVWIPVVHQAAELFHYMQAIMLYLAPPVSTVFLLAIFWRRTNEQGAFWGLMVGLLVGLIRFIWEFSYSVPSCASGLPDPRPDVIKNVHYLHFGIILFAVVIITVVAVSLMTPPTEDKYIVGLTFWDCDAPSDLRTERDVEKVEKVQKKTSDLTPTTHTSGDPTPRTGAARCVRRAAAWVCGIEKMTGETADAPVTEVSHDVTVSRVWGRFCDGNAIVLMVLAVFTWAFYA